MEKAVKIASSAKDFHSISIGNGERASFWFDNWSSLGRLMNSRSGNAQIPLGIPLQATVSQASNSFRRRSFRTPSFQQVAEVAQNVFRTINLSKRDIDKWKAKPGIFTAKFNSKNTWNLIRQPSSSLHSHKAIWFPKSTPKFSFTVWLAHMNRLSTGDRHTNWTSREQVKCLLCGCLLESQDHLFFIRNSLARFGNQYRALSFMRLSHNHETRSFNTSIKVQQQQTLLFLLAMRFKLVFTTYGGKGIVGNMAQPANLQQ